MTIACEREFTLTVVEHPPPEPTAYYKLDSWDGIAIRDSIASLDLTTTSGTPLVVAGKISNAYRNTLNQWFGIRDPFTPEFEITSAFSGRVWFNTPAASSHPDPNREILIYEQFDGVFNSILGVGLTQAPAAMRFRVTNSNGTFSVSAPITLGEWHHIVFWMDPGVEVGISIDNSPKVTIPLVGGFGGALVQNQLTLAGDRTVVGQPLVTWAIDEISLWFNYLITPAGRASDWNSGDGRTWPWPL